jgi:hypothetical protein
LLAHIAEFWIADPFGVSPVLPYKGSLAVVAFASLLASASAQDADDLDNVTKAALAQARRCDDDAARTFAQLANESADTVARAAFEKCRDSWMDANKKYFDGREPREFTDAEVKAHPDLPLAILRATMQDAKENSVEAWKRAEVERLLVVVMEARLKGGHAQ